MTKQDVARLGVDETLEWAQQAQAQVMVDYGHELGEAADEEAEQRADVRMHVRLAQIEQVVDRMWRRERVDWRQHVHQPVRREPVLEPSAPRRAAPRERRHAAPSRDGGVAGAGDGPPPSSRRGKRGAS